MDISSIDDMGKKIGNAIGASEIKYFCPAVIDESVEHAVSEPALKDSQMN